MSGKRLNPAWLYRYFRSDSWGTPRTRRQAARLAWAYWRKGAKA